MKVMIVVTHLLGTGHLSRALTLAQAFRSAGHQVLVASGGVPPVHLDAAEVLQLPPLRSDGVDFTRLLDAEGTLASAEYMAARADMLTAALRDFQPDALITELFPFGRRNLKAEFLTLLQSARGLPEPPRVFASIRDILAPPSRPAKATFAEETLAAFYDAVLVHADPALTPLDLSWPVTERLRPLLRYTGFVAPPPAPPHPEGLGAGEVLVSAGGGDVGAALFACARRAAALDPSRRWRLLVGGQDAASRSAALLQRAPANLGAEPARPDFRQMLHHAAASVSLCGYNTALDLLQTRCPAVFVPFDAGSEVEQGIRAQALATQPGIETVQSARLTPDTLLAALASARSAPRQIIDPGQTRGAQRTVEIVTSETRGAHAR